MVILAGYAEGMKVFFSSDPGMAPSIAHANVIAATDLCFDDKTGALDTIRPEDISASRTFTEDES